MARRLFGLLVLAAVALAVLTAGEGRSGAQAFGERIRNYDVTILVAADGHLDVSEQITYDFGGQFRHGIFRDVPVRFHADADHDRVYPFHMIGVTADPADTPTNLKVSESGAAKHIRIGDPNRTISGVRTYTIRYRVDRALNPFADHDELFWNAVGQEFLVPIDRATVLVQGPGPLGQVACFAGPNGSRLACASATTDGETATFTDRNLGPQEGVTVVVGLPKGQIIPAPTPRLEERITFRTAFKVTPVTAGLAVILIGPVVAGLILVLRRGRDRRYVGTPVDAAFGNVTGEEEPVPLLRRHEDPVEFIPPDGIRPGQLGTLIDEKANVVDVTATIVDLAVRGYLRIEEVADSRHGFHKPDYKLVQLKNAGPDLRPYEWRLLTALFETGSEVLLSGLKYKFSGDMAKVRNDLYDEVVTAGWFAARPDHVRLLWRVLGIAALVLSAGVMVIAVVTDAALAVLPLPFGALLLLLLAGRLPRRTAKGTAMLGRVRGFREIFDAGQGVREHFAEDHDIFSKYLPYAIVFGCTDKWARTFADLATAEQTTNWYVGSGALNALVLAHAVDSFSTTAAGTLTVSTPSSSGSSGFGGGGFSGGGGGGGGGGSW